MNRVRMLALAGVNLFALATPAIAQDTPVASTSDTAQGAPDQVVPSDAQAANGAAAQDTVADTTEIVVTARRRLESVQDIPQVVNAVTADSIEKLNLRNFEEIANVVPGLQMRPNANGIGSVTTIRGVNFDVNTSGNNGTVQFYYNDAPLSSGPILQSMFDIQQISVERGPQGTLRGRSTPSGSINVVMRRPDMTEVGGFLQGTLTTRNAANLNGAINIPIIEDLFAIRGSFVVSDDNGNRINPVSGGVDLENLTKSGRVTFRATPFDGALNLQYTFQVTDRKSTFYNQVESLNQFDLTSGSAASPVTIDARDRLAVTGIPSRNHQRFRIHNFSAEANVAGQKVTYILLKLRQHLEAFGASDGVGLFGLNQTAPGFIAPLGPVIPGAAFGQPTDTVSQDTSHEVRLQNNERIGGFLDYVIGYLSYHGHSETVFDQVRGATSNPIPAPGVNSVLTGIQFSRLGRQAAFKEQSIFGNLTAHIGEATEISGGVRKIWFNTDSGLTTFVGFPVNSFVDIPQFRVIDQDSALVYTASIKHEFTRDLMAYASTGTSWRPNTIVIGFPSIPTAFQAGFLATPPEKSRNYEIGFKSNWLNRRLTFNMTAFRQKYTNYPYRTGDVFFFDVPGNQVRSTAFVAPVDVKVKGVEAELSYRPIDNLTIGAIVSYANGKIAGSDVPCLDLNNDNIPDVTIGTPTVADFQNAGLGTTGLDVCSANFRSNNASPWGATIQSEYRLPVAEGAEGFVRGLLSWKGKSQNDPTNPFDDVSSYSILNLYAGVRDPEGAWEVSAFVKNAFNTFRVLTRSNGPIATTVNNVRVTFPNYFGVTVTEPREFGITARVAFGSR